ncbi:hypothetical protein FNH22_05080 [Fulvivirga sp. M361]|uniref:hypothetical protein n=1 Tax=Fulvivirga sp. M361 TaxID=2594266 RepID=UPI00117AD3B1|nr:hypothetical protein [Fulvivirga sp. M361]TRX61430.1 hypothetical protein FNH22_05080 [Fulvivirga sp. M361]
MIEVFATNIQHMKDARVIQGLFSIVFPKFEINFDLSDIDNILRVESATPIDPHSVMYYVQNLGFSIQVLE